MAAPPNLSVAFAFGVNPGTVPTGGQWVDVTAYVESVSVSVGRDDEFSEPSAGTCTLTLANVTGRFDPEFTTGPYYGNLQAMTPVRVMGGVSSADTAVFYGWVNMDGFQVRPQHPADSVVTVTAVDAFELLAHSYLPASVYRYEVLADSPTNLWRLDEAAGSTVALNAVAGGADTPYLAGVTVGTDPLVADDPATTAESLGILNSGTYFSNGLIAPKFAPTGDFTIEAIIHRPSDGGPTGGYAPLSLFASNANHIRFYGGSPAFLDINGTNYALTTTGSTDSTLHLAITRAGTTITAYLNGVQVQTQSVVVDLTDAVLAVGVLYTITSAGTFRGGWVATYGSALSAGRILLHAQAAAGTAYLADTTGARIDRILTMIGWPSTLRLLEPGVSRMPAMHTAGQSGLALILEAAKAEDGRFWVDHPLGGAPRFVGRYAAETAGAHRLTVEEEGLETGIGRWSGANTGATVTQTAAQARTGTKSLQAVSTSLPAGNFPTNWQATIPAQPSTFTAGVYAGFPITGGREYRIGCYGRTAGVSRSLGMAVQWLDYLGGLVSGAPALSASATCNSSGWTAISAGPVTAPGAATQVMVRLFGTVTGETYYFDDLYVIEGPVNSSLSPTLIVLGDDPTAGTSECPYVDLDLADDRIIDVAVTSRRDGPEFTAANATGLGKFLDRPYSETGLELRDDADAKARGERLVNVHGARRRKVRRVRLKPAAATHAAWTQIFARRIGDRVQVKHRPRYGGGAAVTTADGVIEGFNLEYTVIDGASSDLKLSPLETDVATWDYGTWDNAKWSY